MCEKQETDFQVKSHHSAKHTAEMRRANVSYFLTILNSLLPMLEKKLQKHTLKIIGVFFPVMLAAGGSVGDQ